MIIGLSGVAQSGKDTLANILVEEHGYRRIAFADKIRECLYTLNPLVDWITEPRYLQKYVDSIGWEEAKKHPEIRRLLQIFGTEVGRNIIDSNLWIDMALGNLEPSDKVIITDVRYPDEAKEIRWMFGQIWRINRPGVEAINSHASETAMNDWKFDRVIDNDGSIDDLRAKAKEICNGW